MMKTRNVLLLVTAILVVSAGITQAALITNVVRAAGQSGDRAPIGVFDGATAPLATEAGGMKDGNMVFSDRTYPWINTPAEILGSEYVRTFNTDKSTSETDVTYTVTLSQSAWLWITIDDRSWTAFPNQQDAVDNTVKAFAPAGKFKDTGITLFIKENDTTFRPMSVFQAFMGAGTYVFGAQNHNYNYYNIGASMNAIPEPTTLLLLGLGGLIASRKRS